MIEEATGQSHFTRQIGEVTSELLVERRYAMLHLLAHFLMAGAENFWIREVVEQMHLAALARHRSITGERDYFGDRGLAAVRRAIDFRKNRGVGRFPAQAGSGSASLETMPWRQRVDVVVGKRSRERERTAQTGALDLNFQRAARRFHPPNNRSDRIPGQP